MATGQLTERQERRLLRAVLRGNENAVEYCLQFFWCCQVMDDLVDKDRPVSDKDLTRFFRVLAVDIPTNPFYQQFQSDLAVLTYSAINDWLDANALEREDSDTAKHMAYVLRESIVSIVLFCAGVIGGQDWRERVGPRVRHWNMDGTYEDYLKKLEAQK